MLSFVTSSVAIVGGGILAATNTGPDLTSLFQYGVLGILVVLFIFGKVVPGYILEKREQEIEKLREENKALRSAFEDKVIPALIRSTDVLTKFVEGGGK